MKNRDSRILKILIERQKVEISALAKELGVSIVTARKDLDMLEQRGIVRREHGFAVLGSSDDINNRIAYHYKRKLAIATLAATTIMDGDTVMIESGSCCALFAEVLGRANRNVSVITNSAFIASYIRQFESISVLLLGGEFQKKSQVMVGPLLKVCLSQLYVDRLFIGADGYSSELGFTGSNLLRTQAARDMSEHAKSVTILTESEKFYKNSVVPMQIEDKIKTVFTDAGIPSEISNDFKDSGIELLTIQGGQL